MQRKIDNTKSNKVNNGEIDEKSYSTKVAREATAKKANRTQLKGEYKGFKAECNGSDQTVIAVALIVAFAVISCVYMSQ